MFIALDVRAQFDKDNALTDKYQTLLLIYKSNNHGFFVANKSIIKEHLLKNFLSGRFYRQE